MRRSKHYNVLFNVNLLLINKLFVRRIKKKAARFPEHIYHQQLLVSCPQSCVIYQDWPGTGFKAHLLIMEEHPPLPLLFFCLHSISSSN